LWYDVTRMNKRHKSAPPTSAPKWLKGVTEPPPLKALDRIIAYLVRMDRPMYIGNIAVDVRYSIRQTREMLEFLHDSNRVRRLNVDELDRLSIEQDHEVWELLDSTPMSPPEE